MIQRDEPRGASLSFQCPQHRVVNSAGACVARANDLARRVNAVRNAVIAPGQGAEIDQRSILPEECVADPVMPRCRVAEANHLAGRTDAIRDALRATERTEVDDPAILPQDSMEVHVARESGANHLASWTDRARTRIAAP